MSLSHTQSLKAYRSHLTHLQVIGFSGLFQEGWHFGYAKLQLQYVEDVPQALTARRVRQIWRHLVLACSQVEPGALIAPFNHLAELLKLRPIPDNEIRDFDDALVDCVRARFQQHLIAPSITTLDMVKVVDWYSWRVEFVQKLKINLCPAELSQLRDFYYSNQYKTLTPPEPVLTLRFSQAIVDAVSLQQNPHERYRLLRFHAVRDQITAARTLYNFKLMSDKIYEANMLQPEKPWHWHLNKWFVGFGERPLRLLYAFLLLHVIFLIAFAIPGIDLVHKDYHFVAKLIDAIYFNNTTFLTVGYGDVYPANAPTKIVVLIEQLVGFSIVASFVALTLRKWFRY